MLRFKLEMVPLVSSDNVISCEFLLRRQDRLNIIVERIRNGELNISYYYRRLDIDYADEAMEFIEAFNDVELQCSGPIKAILCKKVAQMLDPKPPMLAPRYVTRSHRSNQEAGYYRYEANY